MIIHEDIEYLPLRSAAHIVCGNALELDWNEIVPHGVDYIIGNPPFSGARFMVSGNKSDLLRVFKGWKNAGNLDFVACWFKKAADFMQNNTTRAAFVATNSIVQGESVGVLWSRLFKTVHIDFAHQPFKWLSESNEMAAVHCVVIGFSVAPNKRPKLLIEGKNETVAKNINGYLMDAPNFCVMSRNTPLCDVPIIMFGSMPIDGGNYLFTADEMNEFVEQEPRSKKYFKPYIGAEEFIHSKTRYCLWLRDVTVDEIKAMPLVVERVDAIRQYRLMSKAASTRKLANTPTRFNIEKTPTVEFLLIPRVSSEQRRYIPMGFLPPTVIASDATLIIPNAKLYHFGVLTSSVHMAWTRVVCGRLEMRYRYSATIVYNNFPWCEATTKQRTSIRRTAKRILDVRAKYPEWSLAQLYNDATMPADLRRAHEANDRAVMAAYGFDVEMSETEIVAKLMTMYRRLTEVIET